MPSLQDKESIRQEVAVRLASTRSLSERNELGQYATPPTLAQMIVSHALRLLPHSTSVRYLEPGFGTGPFYSALLSQAESRVQWARGYEIDDDYRNSSAKVWQDTPLELIAQDFVTSPAAQSANLLICNPPYVRHHHLSKELKSKLQSSIRASTGITLSGLSSLYAYFLAASVNWLESGGIAAWLLPTEFLSVNYGRQTLAQLLERQTLLRVHSFDSEDLQFADALVGSSILFLRAGAPHQGDVPVSRGSTLAQPTETRLQSAATLLGRCEPGTVEDALTLGDCFSIRRGIATGCNDFFIMSRQQAAELQLPEQHLQPILPSPRKLTVDQIDADSTGFPHLETQHVLLNYRSSEAELRTVWPTLWRYLKSGEELGVHQRYLCRNRRPWFKQEQRTPAPFLCTYMGRRGGHSTSPLRFIRNGSQAIAANVYLMLYPQPWVDAHLQTCPNDETLIWQSLHTICTDQLLEAGRAYGGGLKKVEPRELASVRAPQALQELADQLRIPANVG